MSIYFFLLLGVAGIHNLYFDHPLSELWLSQPYPPLHLQDQSYLLETDIAIGALLGLIVVGLSRILSKYTHWAQVLDQEFALYFGQLSPLLLTCLAVMSAFAEEVIFRGWLQDYLGVIFTSLIFGLLHIPPKKSHWPWTVSATIMGFSFAYLYEWRGSVTSPFIAHFTINYFNLHALSKLNPNQATERTEST